ncbi:MAG TPA: FAD-dependent monooxygenase [Pseudonocardiaceae bacterium]|nr:FAD-dependent monooxygenase [Pseudonocardiaceae bacterium]
MSITEDVLVVGAGLAGLTLGGALAANGTACRVIEQTLTLGEVGAGIQLAPNATRVLHRLGMADDLRKIGVRPEAVEMRGWADNRVLGRTELGQACERRYGAPYYTVHRAELHELLADRLPADALTLGMRCTGVESVDGGVLARFGSDDPVTARMCVGADGIHSIVRDALAVDEPRFSGQTIYRGVVPADRVPYLLDEPKVVLWLGPRQHFVCYPIAAGRLVSFGATTPAEKWYTESWSMPAHVSDVAEAYRGWHPDVTRVIDAADRVSRWALHDRQPLDRWSTDRTTLIGDAAHPMLPFLAQGANQGIEDAAVLAACLASGLPDPLATYQELRTARTARIQRISQRNATTLHLDDGAEQRDRDSTLVESQRLAEQDWLYGYDAVADVPRTRG